ncbi:hypothetical protein OG949_41205 (plasmid) [Streptomyces scopuliridis]|uniref:hypothetical protein n=1 Tax=Streptomyces scopuliridis TaxID=452529 RepID=UPI002DDBE5ED|nr:hypothetical protein [Streptomyces scopuliridis]WSB39161.1 hypothetical protein OG949_41205 [Streptomyces scopuliridis]
MPHIRPGRVRTKRDNRRTPLLLSNIKPQDINVREGEIKSIVCTDCQTWRRLMGETKLKIREHRVSDKVTDGAKNDRCSGSNQVVKLDISVEQWSEAMLATDSTATGRRSARQHNKPLPAPAKPVTKMTPAPVNASDALTAYREHLKKCRVSSVAGRCGGTRRCSDGARLAALYEQLLRTQPRRDREYKEEARVDALLTRYRSTTARTVTAAAWKAATTDAKVAMAKRSGTRVEEANNACQIRPADTVSEFRGAAVPLETLRISA